MSKDRAAEIGGLQDEREENLATIVNLHVESEEKTQQIQKERNDHVVEIEAVQLEAEEAENKHLHKHEFITG